MRDEGFIRKKTRAISEHMQNPVAHRDGNQLGVQVGIHKNEHAPRAPEDKLNILITGGCGFIGSHLFKSLHDEGHSVVAYDNFNNHLYSSYLKDERVRHFKIPFYDRDLRSDLLLNAVIWQDMEKIMGENPVDGNEVPNRNKKFVIVNGNKVAVETPYWDFVIHLGAHAGVRDSFGKEDEYHSNNIDGTQNLIRQIKNYSPETKVIYASTSSVYGGTPITEEGWKEDFVQAHQLNAYAYTKYINECQFKISGIKNVGLRFFTVYGPWGRPDMALFQFTKNILDKKPIDVYNYGNMKRDFTFIDDIVDGIKVVMNKFHADEIESGEIFNIGRGEQVQLMDFITAIENETGIQADKNLCAKHPADTEETWSNCDKLMSLGWKPKVSIDEGVKRFYQWYKEFTANPEHKKLV